MRKSIHTARQRMVRDLLVEKRKQAGLTQVQLAAKLHQPQSYVSNYERGERRLDLIEFLEIAEKVQFDPIRLIRHVVRQLANSK